MADIVEDNQSSDPASPPDGGQDNDFLEHKDAIFARQLAEVYLLIDNVSNFPNKEIPEAPTKSPQFEAAFATAPDVAGQMGKAGTKTIDWLGAITAIPWPPHPKPKDHMAAQLICARDMLNNAAAPANSFTIAFTQTVLNDKSGFLDMLPRWRSDPAGTTPRLTKSSLAHDIGTGNLANIAYPGLKREAMAFRMWVVLLAWMMAVFTILTFSLSWTVATGSSLLDNVVTARTDYVAAVNAIYEAQKGITPPPASDPIGTAPTTPNAKDTSSRSAPQGAAVGVDVQTYCAPPSATATANTDQGGQGAKAVQKLPIQALVLCTTLDRQAHRLATAQSDLDQWIHNERQYCSWNAICWMASLTSKAKIAKPASTLAQYDDADVDTQWAAAWLHVVGGIVLPILYGVLGAGAAAGRMLSAKLRDTVLTPRDSLMAWVHVGLGSIVGGCIGLFVTPADASTAPGAGHLTLAALCFLAGFAVDGVFQMLERMASATFNTNATANAAPRKR